MRKTFICVGICAVILTVAGVLFVNRYQIIYSQKHSKEIMRIDESADELTVMGYNVRANTEKDKGKKCWYFRAPLISRTVQEYQPSVICLQEVRKGQFEFFENYLSGYNCVYAYRGGGETSECLPIFFRADLYTLEYYETFWLSDTPEVESNTWEQYYPRICTVAVLKQIKTDKKFVVANTHLDYKNLTVQLKSVNLITEKLSGFSLPVILTGDFNCRSDSKTIEGLKQSFSDIGAGYGEEKGTVNGFKHEKAGNYVRIDYMFQSKNSFSVLDFCVIDRVFKGSFASDHFPLFAKLEIR